MGIIHDTKYNKENVTREIFYVRMWIFVESGLLIEILCIIKKMQLIA